MTIRVLIADDHEIVRQGLVALLEGHDDLEIVGDVGSAEEAVKRTGFDDPNVVLMDVRMPGGSGIEACREIRSRFPEVRVLMLSSYADEEALMGSILAGASGYVLKRVKGLDLIEDIRRVAGGESLLDPELVGQLFERLRTGPRNDPLLSKLTDQEIEIVSLIGEGKTNRQIAAELFLAEKTVKNYVSTLLTKMSMSNRSEVAAHVARLKGEQDRDPEEWPRG